MASKKKKVKKVLSVKEKRKYRKISYIIAYVVLIYFSCIFLSCYEHYGVMIATLFNVFGYLTEHPFAIISHTGLFPLVAFSVSICWAGSVYVMEIKARRRDEMERGKEHGDSKWLEDLSEFNKQFNAPYGSVDNSGIENIILSKEIRLGMNNDRTQRNCNVLAIGGSGSGKSWRFIKPNLLQANGSYVVTDPSGECLAATASFLKKLGYKVKIFNISDMQHSNCYNPLKYVQTEEHVLSLIDCLISNTETSESKGGDDFFTKAEKLLYTALIFYLRETAPIEEQNFSHVVDLLLEAEVDENNTSAKSKLDERFDELEKNNPNSIAVKQYKAFRIASGKTLKSIIISCNVRLNVFGFPAVRNLTDYDDIDLGSLGDEKTVLYVVTPISDPTYQFLAAMLYTQLFQTLYTRGESEIKYMVVNDKENLISGFRTKESAEEFIKKILDAKDLYKIDLNFGKSVIMDREEVFIPEINTDRAAWILEKNGKNLKVIQQNKNRLYKHVNFLLDEFANIGKIPQFLLKLATVRKYDISTVIVLQTLSQLKGMYEKDWEAIVGNCDTTLFLGGNEITTNEYISKMLGTKTIITENLSDGGKGGGSTSTSSSKFDLMLPAQLAQLPNDECIVVMRGVDPYRGPKFNCNEHVNFEHSADCDSIKNYFDFTHMPEYDIINKVNTAKNIENISVDIVKDAFNEIMAVVDMDIETFDESVLTKNVCDITVLPDFYTESDLEAFFNDVKQANEKKLKKKQITNKELNEEQKIHKSVDAVEIKEEVIKEEKISDVSVALQEEIICASEEKEPIDVEYTDAMEELNEPGISIEDEINMEEQLGFTMTETSYTKKKSNTAIEGGFTSDMSEFDDLF